MELLSSEALQICSLSVTKIFSLEMTAVARGMSLHIDLSYPEFIVAIYQGVALWLHKVLSAHREKNPKRQCVCVSVCLCVVVWFFLLVVIAGV